MGLLFHYVALKTLVDYVTPSEIAKNHPDLVIRKLEIWEGIHDL